MSESLKAVWGLFAIVGIVGSFMGFAFIPMNLKAGIGFGMLGILCLAVLLLAHVRADRVPDFLSAVPGERFERDGLCFKIVTVKVNGLAFVEFHTQGRYEAPYLARLVLQPAPGFFLTRPNLPVIAPEIDSPAGGYLVTSIPWPILKEFQGKDQSVEIACDVNYPEGRGRMVRYRGGRQVHTAGRAALKGVAVAAGWLAFMGGAFAAPVAVMDLYKPTKLTLKLPSHVEEVADDSALISTQVVWKSGDYAGLHPKAKVKSIDPDF